VIRVIIGLFGILLRLLESLGLLELFSV
jgi:hypothetical protein